MLTGTARARQLHPGCRWPCVRGFLETGAKTKDKIKIKKGHRMCPSDASPRKKCAFPRRAPLTQRRDYDNTLSRMIPGNFGFETAHGQFLTPVISRLPDLGQKVLGAIAVKNQLGCGWRLWRRAGHRQECLDDFTVRALDRHRARSDAKRLDLVCPCGKLSFIYDEVERNRRLHHAGLGVGRCGGQQQAQADESKHLVFHKISSHSILILRNLLGSLTLWLIAVLVP